jgi:hypothetical protein
MSETPNTSPAEVAAREKAIEDGLRIVEHELNVLLENLANWHNLELHYGEIEYQDGKATINLRFF